jgi:hypothetical protein
MTIGEVSASLLGAFGSTYRESLKAVYAVLVIIPSILVKSIIDS